VAVAAVSALLAFFFAISVWGLQTRSKVNGLSDHLERLQTLTGSDIANSDIAALDSLIAELEAIQPQLEDLRSDLWPARVAKSFAGWAPVVGSQLRAAPELADRALWDVEAALNLARAARGLTQTYSLFSGSFEDLQAAYAIGTAPSILDESADLLAQADVLLARSERAAQVSAASGQSGRVGVYASVLENQEPQLREFIDWAIQAIATAQDLGAVVLAADPLLNLANVGGLAALSESAQVRSQLGDLTQAAAAASQTADAALRATPSAVSGTSIDRDLNTLAAALEGLEALGRGARLGLDAVVPALDVLAGSDLGLLDDGGRLLDAIALLQDQSALLDQAVVLLDFADESISGAVLGRGPNPPEFLVQAMDLSGRLRGAVGLAATLPQIAPELLGADGPRTHLVLGQTSDELRASGGFVSGVWLVTFDGGALLSTEYIDVEEVDDLNNLALYPTPPRLLSEHMRASVWLMRDVGWDPDFPVTAAIARSLFRLGQGTTVDGVIAITPWAFLKIAEALGTIETSEGPLVSDQILPVLEEGTDRIGREFMDRLFQGVLTTLNSSAAKAQALDLASAIERSFGEKNVLINFKDPESQRAIADIGWAGELSRSALPGDRDRVVAVDSNVGWSKVDRNIQRTIDYQIELRAGSPSRSRLTLGYKNVSGPGASGCESQQLDRGSAYSLLKNACYWNLLRAFVHPEATLISADRLPLPDHSVIEVSGIAFAGQDTFEETLRADTTVYSGLHIVGPGESREVTFVYQVPESVVEWRDETATYFLELQVQPGTRGRDVQITVTVPQGYEYSGSSMMPERVAGPVVTFSFNMIRDTLLSVDLSRVEAG
jgi:hypothetical protein